MLDRTLGAPRSALPLPSPRRPSRPPLRPRRRSRVSVADGVHAGELAVPLNKSQVLRSDRPFAKALIGNPEIADVLPLDRPLALRARQEDGDDQPHPL